VFLGGVEGARGEEFFHPKVVRDWFEQDQSARAASCVVSVLRAGVPGGGASGRPVLQSVRLSSERSGGVGEVRKRGEGALDTLALSLRTGARGCRSGEERVDGGVERSDRRAGARGGRGGTNRTRGRGREGASHVLQKCKKEDAPGRVTDMPWLQCDACEKWFDAHPKCLDLEKSAVRKLLLEAEDPTADEWVCKGCE